MKFWEYFQCLTNNKKRTLRTSKNINLLLLQEHSRFECLSVLFATTFKSFINFVLRKQSATFSYTLAKFEIEIKKETQNVNT